MTAYGPMCGDVRPVIVGGVAATNARAALIRSMRGAHLLVLDGAVALIITGATIGIALNPGSSLRFDGPAWAAVLAGAAVGMPIAVRRRRPLLALAVVTAGAVACTQFDISAVPYVPVALALYLVGVAVPGRVALPVVPACLVALAAGVVGRAVVDPPDDPMNVVGAIAVAWLVAGGAWACGWAVRTRRAYEEALAGQRAEQALTEERMRIAREVHDVVAHSMSLIAARAGIANHVAATHPEEARAALRLIEDTSRDALRDIRRVLGVLRTGAEAGAPAPPTTLASLDDLAEHARQAGVHVELTAAPATDPPPGVALVAYRVVQEALTNVIKHAGPTRCRVIVDTAGDALHVEVTDSGRQGPRRSGAPPPGGHGLPGLRERVAMYGGAVHAGPNAEGGFTLAARIPYEPADLAAAGSEEGRTAEVEP